MWSPGCSLGTRVSTIVPAGFWVAAVWGLAAIREFSKTSTRSRSGPVLPQTLSKYWACWAGGSISTASRMASSLEGTSVMLMKALVDSFRAGFRRLGFRRGWGALWGGVLGGRDEGGPGHAGLRIELGSLAGNGRNANQMAATGELNLPAGWRFF